jgi:hypothetical protein
LSAQEKQDQLVAQLRKEPEPAAAPAGPRALDLDQAKAEGHNAAQRWAQELTQQKARELERQLELERQRDLEHSKNRGRGRGLSQGPDRDGPDYAMEM